VVLPVPLVLPVPVPVLPTVSPLEQEKATKPSERKSEKTSPTD